MALPVDQEKSSTYKICLLQELKFLKNSDWRNKMTMELFWDCPRIPLPSAPLTKFWAEKLTNVKENVIWALYFILLRFIFMIFKSEFCQRIIWHHNSSGIPTGTLIRKVADFAYLTYRGPHQPDIRPRGETKKPRRPDPMRPLPLCNVWSLRAYSVIDIRIRNWHVCETFRMIWRPGKWQGF